MATRAGSEATQGTPGSATEANGGGRLPVALAGPQVPALRFKMRGKNTLSATVAWTVAGQADTTGAQYTGGNTPLTDISVAATWSL